MIFPPGSNEPNVRLSVLHNVEDVARRQLCLGCGACAYADPKHVAMIDSLDHGRRPIVTGHPNGQQTRAMQICPGIDQTPVTENSTDGTIPELRDSWGPVLQLFEGYAAEPEVRRAASSGGIASALAIFAMEHQAMHGVLHIAAREDACYLNETVMSTTREEVLSRTGSRYAPASPCDGLQQIEDAPAPCVFVGKPCDVIGARRAARMSPALDANLGLTIAFFCAGTPTTRGTLEMLKAMGIDDLSTLRSLRYRGHGWPGQATATFECKGETETRQLSYEASWGDILSRHKQWRCNLCPDRTGESADIAVGDPWYRGRPEGAEAEAGRSLVLARTPRGARMLQAAVEAGYITLEPAESWKLPASQPHFKRVRGEAWGRLTALRLAAVPTPRLPGYHLLRHWLSDVGLVRKVKSFVGAWRRIGRRQLRKSIRLEPHEPSRPATAPRREEVTA